MTKLNPSAIGALRTFSYWIANGTMGQPLLDGIDYRAVLMSEPSALECVVAIYANELEFGAGGEVLNARHAERRAAQWLRAYIDPSYVITPPLADWEIELHAPPGW
jgi:hypothetical protein